MSETVRFPASSNIREATFDPETRTVDLKFAHGRTYPPVTGVSEAKWRQFLRADSKGAFVNANWRNR
jgi:hypothetical protein